MTEADNAQAIEKLKTTAPPLAVRTRKQRALSIVRDTCAAIALVAFGLGWYSLHQSAGVGTCVNTNLSSRNAPAAADAQAHIDFASLLNSVINMPKSEQVKQAPRIRAEIAQYVATLKADQAARAAHPLGQC